MAPRKIRQYRGVVRGLSAKDASAQLKFMSGAAPAILLKTLRSAVANAKHNFDIPEENLKVADVVINGGFAFKRYRPASKGMAHPILKRTSHVTIIIEEVSAPGTTPTARKGRKSQIEDFTAQDVAEGRVDISDKAHVDGNVDVDKPQASDPHPSKQEEAFQKVKMQQMGGDPKKSHRRKSIGD